MGSAGSSVLNLIALTVIASSVSLNDLDVYFVYRDSAESILKIVFISQIGPICIAALRVSKEPEFTLGKILLLGGAITALVLIGLLIVFPHISPYFLRLESRYLITGFSELEIAIIIYCILMWLDSIISTILVQRRLFLQNHACNIISSALLCFLIITPSDLTVTAVAVAYAVSKFSATIPKIIIFFLGKSGEKVQIPNQINSGVEGVASSTISSMILNYAPSNSLLLVNKFSYLAGSFFLIPGLFAIYNIYYRYYTALQNLITVNIFNLSASRLASDDSRQLETDGLIYRHILSFFIIYLGASIVMFVFSLPMMRSHLPEFLTSSYTSLLWSLTLLNFLPDGVNFIMSRRSMMQNNIEFDSRLNTFQAIANLIFLYPSMRFFGIEGLLYSTLMICTFFSVVRLRNFYIITNKVIDAAVLRVVFAGVCFFLLSMLSLCLPAWQYCLATFSISGIFLSYFSRVARNHGSI